MEMIVALLHWGMEWGDSILLERSGFTHSEKVCSVFSNILVWELVGKKNSDIRMDV